jgi:glycosyltransferase involved in cell wall biosynthesis
VTRETHTSERFDVAFYVPRIGPLLTAAADLPAGGAETQVLLVAQALAERGAKVCLLVFELPGIALPASVGNVAVVVRPPYRAHDRVGKLRETAAIWRSIADVDADVVVTRIATPEVGIAGAAAKLLRRRFVYSSSSLSDFVPTHRLPQRRLPQTRAHGHDYDASIDLSRLSRKRRDWELFRLGLRLADAIIVQTEEQARLCRQHFGRSPVLIKSIAEVTPEHAREPEAFLWIGRLVPSKRPQAFVELARALPQARFWMVAVPAVHAPGGPELLASVKRDAATVPNLELLAPRPRTEVLKLVERGVAIVSTADFEGMPNIFLEGWARGVPALALAHDPDGVIERYAIGGFASESFATLVEQTRGFWEQRQRRVHLASRCREYIRDHHAPDIVAVRWQEVLGISRH